MYYGSMVMVMSKSMLIVFSFNWILCCVDEILSLVQPHSFYSYPNKHTHIYTTYLHIHIWPNFNVYINMIRVDYRLLCISSKLLECLILLLLFSLLHPIFNNNFTKKCNYTDTVIPLDQFYPILFDFALFYIDPFGIRLWALLQAFMSGSLSYLKMWNHWYVS